MPSIAKIQRNLAAFNTYARTHADNVPALQSKWQKLFDMPLTTESAKSFSTYYKTMVGTKKSKRTHSGGALTGASLDYGMVPGANVQVYGRFPVEADTDSGTIRDLDVYFQNSLTKGCGTENSSLTVPVEMGSNQTGGMKRKANRKTLANRKSQRKTLRKNARKTLRKSNRKVVPNRKASRKSKSARKTYRRKHSGGDLLTSLAYHPYISTAPPSLLQIAAVTAAGTHPAVPVSGNPTVQVWDYTSRGTTGSINPGLVTPINNEFTHLAEPAPWQISNI